MLIYYKLLLQMKFKHKRKISQIKRLFQTMIIMILLMKIKNIKLKRKYMIQLNLYIVYLMVMGMTLMFLLQILII